MLGSEGVIVRPGGQTPHIKDYEGKHCEDPARSHPSSGLLNYGFLVMGGKTPLFS